MSASRQMAIRAFETALVSNGVVDSAAIDDPEAYDGCETLRRVHEACHSFLDAMKVDVIK